MLITELLSYPRVSAYVTRGNISFFLLLHGKAVLPNAQTQQKINKIKNYGQIRKNRLNLILNWFGEQLASFKTSGRFPVRDFTRARTEHAHKSSRHSVSSMTRLPPEVVVATTSLQMWALFDFYTILCSDVCQAWAIHFEKSWWQRITSRGHPWRIMPIPVRVN